MDEAKIDEVYKKIYREKSEDPNKCHTKSGRFYFAREEATSFFSVIDSYQNLCFINLFVLFFSNDTEFKNFVSLHTFLRTNQIRG